MKPQFDYPIHISHFSFLICCLMSTMMAHAQEWKSTPLHREITYPQPMTGLVLWADDAEELHATYGNSIQLEFAYCLPCKVVTGCETDGTINYDWSSFDQLLSEVTGRGHQLIARFRYEYPSSKDVDGQRGTTAVPAYIKERGDYHETYAANPGGDGPTYYADWSNEELQRFTLQFYTDFCKRYAHDERLAFLEVGFGHWAEYHIYGTKLQLGVNFPSKEFQKTFFKHISKVSDGLPWLVSIDASDDEYSPVVGDDELMTLTFGLFDDSFMHKDHEIGSSDGYNEESWNAIGKGTRWQTGVCGGEISYYSDSDQKNFLNPAGMYGHTWEEQAAKYHITFMIANDAPGSPYGTAERFREASKATGYKLVVKACETDGNHQTRLLVANEGVAPFYRHASFTMMGIGYTYVSGKDLCGLLPGEEVWVTIPSKPRMPDGSDIFIFSENILPPYEIAFQADIDYDTGISQQTVVDDAPVYYNLAGQRIQRPTRGINILRGRNTRLFYGKNLVITE